MKWAIITVIILILWNIPLEKHAPLTARAFRNLYTAMKNETLDTFDYFIYHYHSFHRYLQNERAAMAPYISPRNNDNIRK